MHVFLLQAYAAARFAESCMRALDGDPDVYECAFYRWLRLGLRIVF